MKPLELVQKQKGNLVTQIWQTRAERVLKQVEHYQSLLEFFAVCTVIGDKFKYYLQNP